MTEYLLVECIIDNLVKDKIIDPPSVWKKTAIETQFYFADFFRAGTGSLISLRVSVVNGNHVITSTAFITKPIFSMLIRRKFLRNVNCKNPLLEKNKRAGTKKRMKKVPA